MTTYKKHCFGRPIPPRLCGILTPTNSTSMRTYPLSYTGFSPARLAIALGIIFTAAPLGFLSFAADPPSGTLSVDNPLITYTSGPFLISNPSNQVDGEPVCIPGTCDDLERC
jgi:hypothetical protein